MSAITKEQSGSRKRFKFDRTGSSDYSEKNYNGELVEIHHIEGTPFTATRHEDTWFLMWGKYKLSTGMYTQGDCEDLLEEQKWYVQAAFTIALMHAKDEAEEQERKAALAKIAVAEIKAEQQ